VSNTYSVYPWGGAPRLILPCVILRELRFDLKNGELVIEIHSWVPWVQKGQFYDSVIALKMKKTIHKGLENALIFCIPKTKAKIRSFFRLNIKTLPTYFSPV
jgi:hypothetical protein